MKEFIKEVDTNFRKFIEASESERTTVAQSLAAHPDGFKLSYRRLTSLQAWRSAVLDHTLSRQCVAFFLEAQNDGLVSHVFAQMGAWRSALKSLRSLVENVLVCMYYKDHPVELELWQDGKHRLSFAELTTYFRQHPQVGSAAVATAAVETLQKELSTLSKAVHGSARIFRMTASGNGTSLWSDDVASLGAWAKRERTCIAAVNMLLLTMFRLDVEGGKLPGLRKAISLAVPVSRHAAIRSQLKVNLSKP